MQMQLFEILTVLKAINKNDHVVFLPEYLASWNCKAKIAFYVSVLQQSIDGRKMHCGTISLSIANQLPLPRLQSASSATTTESARTVVFHI